MIDKLQSVDTERLGKEEDSRGDSENSLCGEIEEILQVCWGQVGEEWEKQVGRNAVEGESVGSEDRNWWAFGWCGNLM